MLAARVLNRIQIKMTHVPLAHHFRPWQRAPHSPVLLSTQCFAGFILCAGLITYPSNDCPSNDCGAYPSNDCLHVYLSNDCGAYYVTCLIYVPTRVMIVGPTM